MRSVFTVMASPPSPHFPALHLASIPLTLRKLLPGQSLVNFWLSRSQLLGTSPPKSLDSFSCVGHPAPLLTHCPFLTFLWYGPILLHLFLSPTTPKEAREEVERERNKQVKDWVICVKCSWALLVVMEEENCILKCIMEVVEKILGVNKWFCLLMTSRFAAIQRSHNCGKSLGDKDPKNVVEGMSKVTDELELAGSSGSQHVLLLRQEWVYEWLLILPCWFSIVVSKASVEVWGHFGWARPASGRREEQEQTGT